MIRALKRRLPREPAERRFWAFAAHLLAVWALALSNLALALTAVVAIDPVRRRAVPWDRFRAALVPLGLYALLVIAAVAGSYDPRASLEGIRELLSLLTLPLAFVLLRDEHRIRRLVDGLVVMGALLGLYGLVQLLFGFGGLHNRIRGPFSHWMTYAGVLTVCLLLAAARLAHRRRDRQLWRWAALGIMSLALLLSLTRSAWIGVLPVIILLLALRAPRYLAALVPLGLAIVLLAPVPVIERVGSIFDLSEESNYDRLCMLEAGLLMVTEKPLFGIGPEMVRARYPIYRHPTAPRTTAAHLHNSHLQIAAESGLPALAAYLWLMGAGLVLAVRRFRAEGGWAGGRADLLVGAILVLLAFNLAGLFEDNWSDTEVQRPVLFALAIPFCLPASGARGGEEA